MSALGSEPEPGIGLEQASLAVPASPGSKRPSAVSTSSPKTVPPDGRRKSLAEAYLGVSGAPRRRKSCDCGDLATFLKAAKEERRDSHPTSPAKSEATTALGMTPSSNIKDIQQILNAQKAEQRLRRKSIEYHGGGGEILSTDRTSDAPPPSSAQSLRRASLGVGGGSTAGGSRRPSGIGGADRTTAELQIRDQARKELMRRRKSSASKEAPAAELGGRRKSGMSAEKMEQLRRLDDQTIDDLAVNIEDKLKRLQGFAAAA